MEVKKIQAMLSLALSNEIRVREKKSDLFALDTPFAFPDGDAYQLYIQKLPGEMLRITDMGHTLMHLSYENDIEKFREGTRGTRLRQIMAETFLKEDNGAFFIDSAPEHIAITLFRMGQALTKIHDLSFLKRTRSESTFYDDLQERLLQLLPLETIIKNYVAAELENAADYRVDYRIEGKNGPFFLFGIPNKDKARIVTITLERLLRAGVHFESLLIFADQSSLPGADLVRLSNAGGEMVASLDAESDFESKLLKKING